MTTTLFKRKWILTAVAILIIVVLILAWRWFFGAAFNLQDTAYVYIDNDDTKDSVYAKITQTAHPKSMTGYAILSALSPYQIKSGRYAASANENMISFYRKLKSGRQTPVRLVIPSVRTLDRLAGAMSKKLMLDSATIAHAFTDSAFCSRYGYDTATLACLFIPNTYEIYWNTTLDNFMQRMIKENKKFWSDERMSKAREAGLSCNDVITLASIIDEETANNAEKPMVAGMYINRLKLEMPLQADPTIKFALKDFGLKRIYHNQLNINNPYNTYRNIGLPPGPIRIASIAGIDAVLNHVKHDYLYMCAKEDFSGTHNFARTYEEHLLNAARYSEALNKRGIK